MERIENEGTTYYPQSLRDGAAEKLNHFANEVQRPFWYSAQNFHRYYANPLNEPDLMNRVVKRVLGCGVHAAGATLGLFLALSGFVMKGLSNRFHSREFTYWEGQGKEVQPEHPKVLHLNACMFPGNLPYMFGGVRTAGERMEELKAFVEEINPDILFLCEMTQTLSGKLYEVFGEGYRHFFVNVGSNAQGMDASMAVISREPIVSEPRFFPSEIESEREQKYSYRGFFHVETEKANYLYMHLHPKETKRAKEIRQEQLDEMVTITQEHANGKVWVVLGDLNIERGTEGHQKMLEKGFRDVIQEQHGNVETCQEEESIDGFYTIGGELKMTTQIHDTYADSQKALSDHKGISAVLC